MHWGRHNNFYVRKLSLAIQEDCRGLTKGFHRIILHHSSVHHSLRSSKLKLSPGLDLKALWAWVAGALSLSSSQDCPLGTNSCQCNFGQWGTTEYGKVWPTCTPHFPKHNSSALSRSTKKKGQNLIKNSASWRSPWRPLFLVTAQMGSVYLHIPTKINHSLRWQLINLIWTPKFLLHSAWGESKESSILLLQQTSQGISETGVGPKNRDIWNNRKSASRVEFLKNR